MDFFTIDQAAGCLFSRGASASTANRHALITVISLVSSGILIRLKHF